MKSPSKTRKDSRKSKRVASWSFHFEKDSAKGVTSVQHCDSSVCSTQVLVLEEQRRRFGSGMSEK